MSWLSFNAVAKEIPVFNAVDNPVATQDIQRPKQILATSETKAITEFKLKDIESNPIKAKQSQVLKKSRVKAITQVSDLAGKYVQSYLSLTSSVADGGKYCIVTPVTGKDSVIITNFWDKALSIKAKIDIANKSITIPSQQIAVSSTYGPVDLALCSSTGAPDRKSEIKGTINDDGSFTIDSWWGIFINSGDYADKFLGAYYNTTFEKSNGTMGITLFDKSNDEYGVIINQESSNVVTVKNFGNYGQTVEILLNRDASATIASQPARLDITNGTWMTYATTYDNSGTLTGTNSTITCNIATDKRNISWGNWSIICTKYYLGAMTSGKVTADFDITYPHLDVTDFEGEGTEASPYLIKKTDDLVLLSDKVNGVTEFPYSYGTLTYARPYLNKYFRVENDIDMTGYRFTPIANQWKIQFAGVFDGNGKKITGLNVSTGSSGYAALFGKCDTTCVIKNLTMINPKVETEYYYAASIAGWSLGEINNCHVIGAEISNTKIVSGAIGALVNKAINCTVSKSVIIGQGGIAGGAFGEIDESISDCHVSETTIYAGGLAATYPSGGVMGELYKDAKAVNCSFSGTLDGSKITEDLFLGGITGMCYIGNISKCFNTGTIKGSGSQTAVGGVVGAIVGSMDNCYNTGFVYSPASRRAGGITGLVSTYTDANGSPVEAVIKDCYSAGTLNAETYQYDPNKEVRETLGTIDAGSVPVIENIYFDNQMVNLTSKQYGVSTATLTSAAGPGGFKSDNWVFTEGYYPRIKGLEDTEVAKFSASAIQLKQSNSLNKIAQDAELKALGNTKYYLSNNGNFSLTGHNCYIDNNYLKVSTTFGTDTLFAVNGSDAKFYFIKISPVVFDGEGSELNPFLIKTKADLVTLSNVTTQVKQYFSDTYFKMTNDIDLEYDPAFTGICSDSDDAHCQFDGNFDGGGFTVHNMLIEAVAWTTKPSDSPDGYGTPNVDDCKNYKGFIGRLSPSGSLKNLSLAKDCKISLWGSGAAMVGYNYGLIDNCKNYADVVAHSCWVGGMAGQNLKGGTISNCYNAGKISTGYMDAGGMAGTNYGTIINSMNTGDIAAEYTSHFSTVSKLKFAGGIAGGGNGAIIKNVVNTGTITGYATVGGIVGSYPKSTTGDGANDMSNAINYGTVWSTDPTGIGGISGASGSEGSIVDNYWDAQIIPLKATGNTNCEGMNGVETSKLISGTALENYSTDIWDFTANSYPVLKQFATEEAVVKARKIIINIAAGITAKDLSSPASLSTENGCTWKLLHGTDFTINGNTLNVPATVAKITTDTLIATCGSMIKPFTINRVPAIPFAGNGTEADPYQIATTSDWNALSDYISICSNSFEGKFLKVMNDIDFTDKGFSPIANNGVTYFEATLLGNNKTVKGIKYTTANTYVGAFGVIGAGATINDLTLEGQISSTNQYLGGFAGILNGKLVNCVNNINVTSTKANVGGFAATINSGAALTNCVNKGTISSAGGSVAGFTPISQMDVSYVKCGNEGTIENTSSSSSYAAGLIATSYPATFTKCYNTGAISITNPTAVQNVAGLIAYANAVKDSRPYILDDCYNTASISGKAIVAGLVAASNSSSYNVMQMTDCYNTGDIAALATSAVSGSPTAGISAFYTPGSTFTRCYNTGSLISDKNVYIGGISGYYKSAPTESTPVKFIDCSNSGDIIASGNQGAGIVGFVNNYITISGCVNTGNIEGGFGLGGIVAALSGNNSVVENCWNSGNITTSTNRAGGIIGYNSYAATVSNCFNTGNISSTSTTQGTGTNSGYGIGGIAGQGGAKFTNCYNTGVISGVSQVGGVIGVPYKATTTLSYCYNAGKIIAPVDTCGGLIGVNTSNAKMWTTGNSVTNSYFVSDFGAHANDAVGDIKTMAQLASMDLGQDWISGDNYSLPILDIFKDEDCALVNSAAVILSEGDTYEKVTKNFFVGQPKNVVWSINPAEVSINGNNATFGSSPYTGDLTLTATIGKYSKAFTITCNAASGVNSVGSSKTIVNEKYFNTSGIEVIRPESNNGAVYVVIRTYDDGTHEVVKVIK